MTAQCLKEWTVQSLIVFRTLLVLVRGKLVLQKNHLHNNFRSPNKPQAKMFFSVVKQIKGISPVRHLIFLKWH